MEQCHPQKPAHSIIPEPAADSPGAPGGLGHSRGNTITIVHAKETAFIEGGFLIPENGFT